MQAVSKTAKITLFPSYGTIMPQPSAQQILHEVFGYPEFRGKQEAIVNTLAGGGGQLVGKWDAIRDVPEDHEALHDHGIF